jgi:choline dehydrogenase-like flavoprotein
MRARESRLTRRAQRLRPRVAALRAHRLCDQEDHGAIERVFDTWIANECFEFHHPCGTCKMGDPDQPDVVVDRSCNVVGIEGLRVADASIFPDIPRANTNLAAIMVGEHVATLVANH